MLKFNIRGENVEVTDAIRDYVVKRISKLQKFFEDSVEATAHVNLKVYSNRTYKVEVTIPLPYLTLRAEETSNDMYGSVDLVRTSWNGKSVSTRPRLTGSPVKRA